VKTIPVRELSQNGASKVIAAAEVEPVLVTKNNEPAVWMVSAREVALVSEQLTGDRSVYGGALAVVGVDLYRQGILSIGRAARMAGTPLVEFIVLCGRLQVPVLQEPPGGLEGELAGPEAALRGERSAPRRDLGLPETAPVPHGDRESVRVSALVNGDTSHGGSLLRETPEEYLVDTANLVV
jgi:antitoxin (DNA-binding transcriptional repressor) of toxin-antitoxin stability system